MITRLQKENKPTFWPDLLYPITQTKSATILQLNISINQHYIPTLYTTLSYHLCHPLTLVNLLSNNSVHSDV